MSVTTRTTAALGVPLLTLPLMAVAQAPALSVPAPPEPPQPLPTAVDVAPRYQMQTTCDPTAKPGPVAFAKMLNATYGTQYYGISRNCNSGVTEHSEGRALDWMISAYDPQQKAIADSIVQWLSATDDNGNPGAMARRFGINYIIWNRKVWRAYAPERGWADYTGSHPHDDHIHITFTWDGAYQRTSWWTGVALTTVATSADEAGGVTVSRDDYRTPIMTSTGYTIVRLGSTGDDVKALQRGLGIDVDGNFGQQTLGAVTAFQQDNGLVVDGVVGVATWGALIAKGLVPSRTETAPAPGPTTATSGTVDLSPYTSTTLRLGSRGEAVKALQKALGGLTADGVFGSKTYAAVRSFQSAQGLVADGIVGPKTWAALVAAQTGSDTGAAEPEPTPEPEPEPEADPTPEPAPSTSGAVDLSPYTSTTLRLGSRGEAVKALQKALGGLTADGVFGSKTYAAVRSFQSAQGLVADGIVGPKTWAALVAAQSGSSTTSGSTSGGSSGSTAGTATSPLAAYASTTLRVGSRGEAVKALQKALGGLTVDGVFGSKTESAVRGYQSSRGLEVTGVVGSATWKALVEAAPATSSPTPAQESSDTLRRGDRGEAVKALQRLLGGLYVDGIFGAKTEAAVKAFQSAAGLTADGVVTPEVMKAIEAQANPLLAYADVVLKRGSTGTAVKVLQKALGGLVVDGIFGAKTEAAVKEFQSSAKLSSTGVVGPLTWEALARA